MAGTVFKLVFINAVATGAVNNVYQLEKSMLMRGLYKLIQLQVKHLEGLIQMLCSNHIRCVLIQINALKAPAPL